MSNKVTIYSTPTCVYCNMTKEFFEKNSVVYDDHNVAEDDDAREEMINKSHQMGVPVIDINGKIIIGYDEAALSKLLGIK